MQLKNVRKQVKMMLMRNHIVYTNEILKFTKLHLREKIPYLAKACYLAEDVQAEAGSGTDGIRFFWNPDEVTKTYRQSPEGFQRRYLHLLLHGLYLHAFRSPGGAENIWWLACDLVTEYRIDRMNVPGFERPVPVARSRAYRKLKEEGISIEERAVAGWLTHRKKEELDRLKEAFRWDDHSRWAEFTVEEEAPACRKEERFQAGQLREISAAIHRWRTAFEELDIRREEHKRQAGGSGGSQIQQIVLEKEPGYDFRRFLKQFAVEREELSLDLDSFDYLPYDYSRNMYENLVILEPLEYRDMIKLEEFVIAIDTSGSCSGEVVRQFLEEVWEIFREKDNFFKKMELHMIQCDCLIQEHVRIQSEEEWKDYLEHIEIKGHGDTDFTPVFQLIDRLRAEGELGNLKGLLYFTDGDGVYPSKGPEYETAFVFLNADLMKGKPPDWVQVLTLDKE